MIQYISTIQYIKLQYYFLYCMVCKIIWEGHSLLCILGVQKLCFSSRKSQLLYSTSIGHMILYLSSFCLICFNNGNKSKLCKAKLHTILNTLPYFSLALYFISLSLQKCALILIFKKLQNTGLSIIITECVNFHLCFSCIVSGISNQL